MIVIWTGDGIATNSHSDGHSNYNNNNNNNNNNQKDSTIDGGAASSSVGCYPCCPFGP
jgi:hypothetical protein